jgi:ketosteroid isomerase-like protein
MRSKFLSTLVLSFATALFGSHAAMAEHRVTIDILTQLVAAFNAHDLDAVISFFADDCELMMPRGPDPWGQRYVGKAAVREGLATRFEGIPDVHYGDVHNWVSGNHGVSQWTLTGTTRDGQKITVRGCDLLEFRNGKIIRKDSYWKIVEPTK